MSSRFRPSQWLPDYEQRKLDPEVQRSLRHELALNSGVTDELLKRLNTGENHEAWIRLGDLLPRLEAKISGASRQDAPQEVAGLLRFLAEDLIPTVRQGCAVDRALQDITHHSVAKARMLEAQTKVENMIPAETLKVLMGVVGAVLVNRLGARDPHVLRLIQEDLAAQTTLGAAAPRPPTREEWEAERYRRENGLPAKTGRPRKKPPAVIDVSPRTSPAPAEGGDGGQTSKAGSPAQ